MGTFWMPGPCRGRDPGAVREEQEEDGGRERGRGREEEKKEEDEEFRAPSATRSSAAADKLVVRPGPSVQEAHEDWRLRRCRGEETRGHLGGNLGGRASFLDLLRLRHLLAEVLDGRA